MKKNNNKGFTLAELLIVVAIVAVLTAIAIPIFNTQLEKAREATDVANARDYYAEIAVALVDGTLNSDTTTMQVSGNLEATAVYTAGALDTVTVAGTTVNQKTYTTWQSGDQFIAGVKVGTAPASASATSIVYTFQTDSAGHTSLKSIAWTVPAGGAPAGGS